ncbi:hypothetical protein GOC14_07100 [Sinorhizobium meliloti]|nr:hypothetical protein [Sinorhizobium meliloti]
MNIPAFPSLAPPEHWGDPARGMDLRDWFAGQALVGLLARNTAASECPARAYQLADEMMKIRKEADG